MAIKLIAFLLLSISILSCGQAVTTYYVTPSSVDLCPEDPCFTLSNYTANPNQYFVSGATFIFLPGEHQLRSDGFVVIRDITNLSLVGSRNASVQLSGEYLLNLEPAATISCPDEFSGGFAFLNVSNLRISSLGFSQCGAVIPPGLAKEALTVQTTSTFVIPEYTLKSALFLVNVHSLDMNTILIENSYGYGLLAINVIGDVDIHQCYFMDNNFYTCRTPKCIFPTDKFDIYDCVGGNVRFLYSDPSECPLLAENYTVRIHQSKIYGGVDFYGSFQERDLVNRGTGLGVSFAQKTFGVSLVLSGLVIYGNTGGDGANLYLQSFNEVENSSVIIENCIISHGNVLYPPLLYIINGTICNLRQTGVGMAFYHGAVDNTITLYPDLEPLDCDHLQFRGEATQEILAIHNSSFVNNDAPNGGAGVGVHLAVFPHINDKLKRTITIDGANVSNNHGPIGVGLSLYEALSFQKLDVIIANSVFSYNKRQSSIIAQDFQVNQFGTLNFLTAQNVSITNCQFFENGLSAISATDSNLIFGGDVLFMNNFASNGGAISLFGDSVLFLTPHVHMDFTENFAVQTGGAIYMLDDYILDPKCLFQVSDPTILPTSQLDISLTFENNSALEAGDVLYGGMIDQCAAATLSGFLFSDNILQGGEIFDEFAVIRQEDLSSVVSSNPERVCLCVDGTPDCDLPGYYEVSSFPGQSFQLPLVAVGQRQGAVPAVVRSYFVAPSTAKFGELQDLQTTRRYCTNLTYTVKTNSENETMAFVPEGATKFYSQPLTPVTLTLLPCPIGFQLSKQLGTCSCSQPLQNRNVTCNIDEETITRVPPYWFSAKSGELALHDHCPFDYCCDKTVEMFLSDPDTQCEFDRSGILCGGCRDGLSLLLGTSKCKKCSNVYLLLVIPFAIMGILLVVLLSLLNLTVKLGTIHGLIFYANVVKINQAAFFPPGEVSFFTVFLSWLNLDFGIESCFFDGLDAYSNTWLQFAFPLYIWVIGITIIVCARYSTRVSEIFSNSVHVLDTIFLLSYTKILRVIITSLSFTILEYQGTRDDELVWLSDGSLKYGEGKHIALIIIASLFLLLAFPYTFILIFTQFLRRYSHKWAFQWVAKFKPYLDAYTGPYKDAHGYWTGLLLLARVIFVLVFAFNVLGDPAVNIMVVNIVSFLLALLILGSGRVYKSWILNVLEASLLVNLGILSAATCYISVAGGNQQALVHTSVSVAFVEFIGILLFHILLRLKERYGLNWPKMPNVVQCWHRAPFQPPVVAQGQLAVDVEELIRPGAEGLFDDDTRNNVALQTTYGSLGRQN